MKLALLAARLPPARDGVGDHADRLAGALAAAGHDVAVYAAGEAVPSRDYRLELSGASWGALATARAIAQLRRDRPDALIAEYTPFLYGARSAAPAALLAAARALGVRTLAIAHETFHGSADRWKTRAFAARDAATLMLAGTVAVPGAARAAELARRLPALRERIAVVPIGANVEPPAVAACRARTAATIVTFGVVMPRRRLELALAALAALVARGADARLAIIGRVYDAGYAAEIAGRAAASGLGARLRWCGELAPHAVSAELAGACAALHTNAEGSIPSSGSLLALLAHGVPTVALRTRDDDPIFAGALHFAADPAEAASALHAFVAQPASAAGLARAAAACYHTNFAWPVVADRLVNALEKEAVRDARLAPA